MTISTRNYRELTRLETFEERFDYLSLRSEVGRETFGFERYLNQQFYASTQWKYVRDKVIARDDGLDLGFPGREIFDRIIIHHIQPMSPEDIDGGNPMILDPNNLITTCHKTHNAIHFGDASLLAQPFKDRTPGDTRLW